VHQMHTLQIAELQQDVVDSATVAAELDAGDHESRPSHQQQLRSSSASLLVSEAVGPLIASKTLGPERTSDPDYSIVPCHLMTRLLYVT
jgi:hypothetical protein